MATWVFCDDITGEIVTAGIASEDGAGRQPPREGQTLYVVPDGMIDVFVGVPDLARLKEHLRAAIDKQAGGFRILFITDVPGQAQTYERKEREARQWTAGDETAHPDLYPFMLAEAEVRGMPIEDVRDEIMAQVNALTPLAAAIEAHRVNAKQAVLAATTLPAIMAAAQVDWQALLP